MPVSHRWLVCALVFAPFTRSHAAEPAATANPAAEAPAPEAQKGLEELMAMEEFLRIDSVSLGSFDGAKMTETPAAVSVITQDMWRNWGPTRMWDAMRFMPGVYVIPDFVPEITIRGFLNRNVQKEVSLNIDGTNLAASMLTYININPLALQRIEVMRGPGGTIYGSDAFAGAVGFDTWTAKENRVEVEAGGGGFGSYNVAARGHYRFTDKFSGTLIVAAQGQNNAAIPYSYSLAPGAPTSNSTFAEQFGTQNYILKFNYDDSYTLGIYLSNNAIGGWPFVGGPGTAPGTQVGMNFYSGLITATGHQGLGMGFTLDEALFAMGGHMFTSAGLAPGPVTAANPQGINKVTDMLFGGSLRLSQHVEAVPIEWNLVYQFRDSAESENTNEALGTRYPKGPATGVNTVNHGIILSGSGHAFEHMLNINGGVRYDYFSFQKISNFSGNAMVSYVPTEGTAIKAIYARGFRAPVPSELLGMPPFFLPNAGLKPETLDTYELVVLSKHDTWQAEITGFYGRTQNQINNYPAFTGAQVFENFNRGALDGWGIEAAGDISLRPVAIRGALTYNYSRQLAEGGLQEQQILGFPAWILDLGVQYDIAVAELTLSAYGRGMFSRGAGLGLPGYLANYFHGDLSATWRFGRLFHIPGGEYEVVGILNNFTNSINAVPSLQVYPGMHEPGIRGQGMVRWMF